MKQLKKIINAKQYQNGHFFGGTVKRLKIVKGKNHGKIRIKR
ncbi:hypothetical protein ACFL0Y_03775 [Patescibacteria group bacterium]